jgi:hypothetical protein
MDISRSSGSSTVLGFVLCTKVIKKQKPTICEFFYGLLQHGSAHFDRLSEVSPFFL